MSRDIQLTCIITTGPTQPHSLNICNIFFGRQEIPVADSYQLVGLSAYTASRLTSRILEVSPKAEIHILNQ